MPEELTGEGHRARRAGALRGDARPRPRSSARRVERVALPHADYALSAYYVLAPAEASSNLARYDGVRYGLRARRPTTCSTMYTQTRHDGFGAEVKRRIMLGTYALSSGYYDAYYGRAQRVRTKIAEDFRAAFERFDFVVTPTSPGVAFELGAKTDDPLAMYLNDYFTVPMSLAGHPRDLDPVRAERGAAGRLPARGPGVQREPHPRRGLRARAGDRLRRLRREARRMSRATSPSSAWRSTSSSRTRTKMFCGCALSFGEPPNTRTCPVCLGLPGALPVANAEAIHYGLLIGLALGCELAPRSIFHRKNYFYPDNCPRATRSASTTSPCAAAGGWATCASTACTSRRTRPSSSTPARAGASTAPRPRVVDFNRGGTPLVGDRHRARRALGRAGRASGCTLLRTTLRQLGVSDVNMEEGSLRCDANVSHPPGRARASSAPRPS